LLLDASIYHITTKNTTHF